MLRFGLLLLLICGSTAASAAENCAAKWSAVFSAAIPCEAYTPGSGETAGASYFLEAGGADDGIKQAVLDIAADAYVASKAVYEKWGALSDVVFIAVKQNHPQYDPVNNAIWGTAEVEKRKVGEPCPVVLYPAVGEATNGQRVRQLVAHELFHCWQFDNLRGQLNGDPKPGVQQYWTDITMWWAEGSADYFSNLVYPSADLERNGQASYDFKKQIHLQTGAGAYGVSLFFQSMGNNMGPETVIELLRSLPTKGNDKAQRAALAAFQYTNSAFHYFGQELIDKKLKDSSGAPIDINFNGEWPEVEVEDGMKSYAMTAKPFILRPVTFRLQQGRIYTFPSLLEFSQTGDMKAAYSVENIWQEAPSDLKFDTRCNGMPIRQVILLFTRTDDGEPDTSAKSAKAELNVMAEQGDCPCQAMEALPVCFVGNWRIDNGPTELALKDSQSGMTMDPISGAVRINMNAGGVVKLNLADWTLVWRRTKEDDSNTMRWLKLVFTGQFNAIIGKAKSGKLCVIPTSDQTTLAIEAMVTYMGASTEVSPALSNPEGDPLASSEVEMNCVGDEIFYSIPVAGKTPVPGRLVRE